MRQSSHRLVLTIVFAAGLAASQEVPVGMITKVEGIATVYDGVSKAGRQAELADLIFPGTRIVTGDRGKIAFIFCPEQLTTQLPARAEASFTSSTVQTKGASLQQSRKIPSCRIPIASASISNQRLGGVTLRGEHTLHLYSPTGTRVLPTAFYLRWSPVAGADSYRLEVRDGNGDSLWESISKTSSSRYEGARLKAGKEYRWRVSALQEADLLASASGWFRVVSSDEENRIKDMKQMETANKVPSLTSHLLMGFLYEELEMPDLALAQYEKVPAAEAGNWVTDRIRNLRKQLRVER